jgi:carbon-monoxide dehydrogenase small subunit
MKRNLELNINGEIWDVEVEPHWTLLETLREVLGFTGAKEGCGLGACGSCTVLADGAPLLSCLALTVDMVGKSIETIEGLIKDGKPDVLQEAFVNKGAIQCGFCTPGMILNAKSFLEGTSNPSREDIREAIAGNLCRCTGYQKIVDAIESLSGG